MSGEDAGDLEDAKPVPAQWRTPARPKVVAARLPKLQAPIQPGRTDAGDHACITCKQAVMRLTGCMVQVCCERGSALPVASIWQHKACMLSCPACVRTPQHNLWPESWTGTRKGLRMSMQDAVCILKCRASERLGGPCCRRGQAALAGVRHGGLREQQERGGPLCGGGGLPQHRAPPQARPPAYRLLPLLHGRPQRAGARPPGIACACMHARFSKICCM